MLEPTYDFENLWERVKRYFIAVITISASMKFLQYYIKEYVMI